ncbi:hypothetical protein LTR08_008863 [Meristemomyces frigidus]|nr:hypothetical protein LTR08_008863 [Meristemomyces frigidus]
MCVSGPPLASINIGAKIPKRPLCFEDGDIIIELAPECLNHLLVHKAVLKEAMPMLEAAATRWHDPDTQTKEDVKNQPLFNLALARKVRCPEVFADALRHLVGSGAHYSDFGEAGLTKGEAAALVCDYREQLDDEIERVLRDIKRLFMTDYIAHSNTKNPDIPVGTTFVSSSWEVGKTIEEKAEWLAKCICRD